MSRSELELGLKLELELNVLNARGITLMLML
jgi:hypothetical protein